MTQFNDSPTRDRHDDAVAPAEQVPRRIVLLGASNLTRGIAPLVETARRFWGQPLEIYAALGHGRSYGQRSSVLIRTLPGIAECGLWDALVRRPAAPTVALIADVGNDILYNVPVTQLIDWMEQVLDRLESAQAVLMLPPVCNFDAVATWRFQCLIKLLYPKYCLSPGTLLERVHELDRSLRKLAENRDIRVIEPRREWYGFDPIHFRRHKLSAIWAEVLGHWWNPGAGTIRTETRAPSFRHWLQLRTTMPERVWFAGFERLTPQPAVKLEDGTTVALY